MRGASARPVAVRLAAEPRSSRAARSRVRRALEDEGLHQLVDVATLLVSELVTNAVLHAGTEIEVRVERRGDGVRVSVLDASPRRPARRRYGLSAGTGRGLGLVETMSTSWGTSAAEAPWAKAVWFDLSAADAARSEEGALYGADWLSVVDDL